MCIRFVLHVAAMALEKKKQNKMNSIRMICICVVYDL